MTGVRSAAGWLLWLLAAVVALGHVGLGVLAVVEYARLDWLTSEPYELTAVSAVAASAALVLLGAIRAVWPAVRGAAVLRGLLRSAGQPPPAPVRAAAQRLGVDGRVDVVAAAEAFAVTHGLWRPRILLSTGLLEALDTAELTAVLAHERHHLQARDPLRLLGGRLLGGYGWFLPVLGWWTRRAAVRREVAADRAAIARAGVAAVAGALLKLADRPTPAAVAAANPAGNLPERIAHLEGQPPRPHRMRGWLLGGATMLNLAGLFAAVTCCAGLGVAMLGGMT
jgi:beta-lactamase regulating signal transducer with metallopeptidase domain